MNTGDLLGQSGCIDQVGAPRRRDNAPTVGGLRHGCADVGQNRFDFGGGVLNTNSIRDVVGGQGYGRCGFVGNLVVAEFVDRSPTEFDQQVDDALGGGAGNERVDTAGETLGRFGRQFVATSRARDGDGVERRGLDQNVGRRVIDFGRCTTHDTGQTDRSGFVADEKVFGVQLSNLLVEGRQRFARLRAANRDSARELVKVVRVGRLAELHHDVVGNVNGQRNRADSHERESLNHPRRGGCAAIKATDHASDEARATHGSADRRVIGDFHRETARLADGDGVGRVAEGNTGRVRVFASNTTDRHRVAAIGRHVDLDGEVVQTEQCDGVLPDLGVEPQFGQTKDSGVFVAQTQFTRRGDHAVGDVAVGLASRNRERSGQDSTGK